MALTTVVNLHLVDSFDVYIGRSGRGYDGYFGNPFSQGSRAENIARFRVYFARRMQSDPEFKRRIEGLSGLRLGCFCAPAACHGDVYKEYLDGS